MLINGYHKNRHHYMDHIESNETSQKESEENPKKKKKKKTEINNASEGVSVERKYR